MQKQKIDNSFHYDNITLLSYYTHKGNIMIDTITKAELLASIAHLPDDARLAVGMDFRDRVSTTQAIGLEVSPTKAYVVASDYSDSGYKLVSRSKAERELGDDVECNKVYVLNSSALNGDEEDEDDEDDEF